MHTKLEKTQKSRMSDFNCILQAGHQEGGGGEGLEQFALGPDYPRLWGPKYFQKFLKIFFLGFSKGPPITNLPAALIQLVVGLQVCGTSLRDKFVGQDVEIMLVLSIA